MFFNIVYGMNDMQKSRNKSIDRFARACLQNRTSSSMNMRKEKGNDKQKPNVCEMSRVSYTPKQRQNVENEYIGTSIQRDNKSRILIVGLQKRHF